MAIRLAEEFREVIMAVPFLLAVKVAGAGVRWLAPKIAQKLVKEGKGILTGRKAMKGTDEFADAMETRQAYRTLRLSDRAKAKKAAEATARRSARQTKIEAEKRELTRKYGPQTPREIKKQKWRELTPAQRKAAGQTLANLEKNIAESAKVAKPSKVSPRQKGMRLPGKGETPLRKRGGIVSRKSGGKIMYGYKAGGSV